MEQLTDDSDKSIAEGLSLEKLELYVGKVTNTANPLPTNTSRAGSQQPQGDFGGYESYEQWATKDPEGYKKKHSHPIYKLRKGVEWNTMLEDIRDSYAGVYYSLNAFDVVSLFIPYEATRVPPEEQARLEGE